MGGVIDDLSEFQRRVKRGVIWRVAFLSVDAAFLLWLGNSLNGMRLYTIWQAPSYVPQSVDQYWMALGAAMATAFVLISEFGVFAWRAREIARSRFPGSFPRGPTAGPSIPPPPPGFDTSGH